MRRDVRRWIFVFVALPVLAGGAAPALGSQLSAGQQLPPGSLKWSSNGRVLLTMQRDGNLVLYHRVGEHRVPVWAAGTRGQGAFAVLQSDGNLVVYQGRKPLWSSATNGKGGARLAVQDDGNLVLYTRAGVPVWSTSTSLDGRGAARSLPRKPSSGPPMRMGRVYFARRVASRPRSGSRGRPALPSPASPPRSPPRTLRFLTAPPAPPRTDPSAVWEVRRGKGPSWCFRLIVQDGTPVRHVVWLGGAPSQDDALRKIERVSRLAWSAKRRIDGCDSPHGHEGTTSCFPWMLHRVGSQYWFELPNAQRDHWGATQRANYHYARRNAKEVSTIAIHARLKVQKKGPGRVIYSRGRSWCR